MVVYIMGMFYTYPFYLNVFRHLSSTRSECKKNELIKVLVRMQLNLRRVVINSWCTYLW